MPNVKSSSSLTGLRVQSDGLYCSLNDPYISKSTSPTRPPLTHSTSSSRIGGNVVHRSLGGAAATAGLVGAAAGFFGAGGFAAAATGGFACGAGFDFGAGFAAGAGF